MKLFSFYVIILVILLPNKKTSNLNARCNSSVKFLTSSRKYQLVRMNRQTFLLHIDQRTVTVIPMSIAGSVALEKVRKLTVLTGQRITRITYDLQNEMENVKRAERKIGVCQ